MDPTIMPRSYSKIFCFALSILCFLFQQKNVQGYRVLPECRGGVTIRENEPLPATVQLSLGIFSIGEGCSECLPTTFPWLLDGTSCVLFDKAEESSLNTPILRIGNLPQDDDLATCLAILSDVLVVLVPPNCGDKIVEKMVDSLVEGANRRRSAKIQKGKLILVSSSVENTLLIRKKLSTSDWEGFEIVSHLEQSSQWKKIQSSSPNESFKGTVSTLLTDTANSVLFVELMQQVYESIHGAPSETGDFTLQSIAFSPEGTDNIASEKVSKSPPRDQDALVQDILVTFQAQIKTLESRMEEALLGDEMLPLLDFGDLANEILDQAHQQLEKAAVPPSYRLGLLQHLVKELQRLYKDQLQALRNYYGSRYETALESHDDEGEWSSAAEYTTQGFQAAATHAIPTLCQADGALNELATEFDFVKDMQGLLKDMMEATQLRKDEQSLALENEEDDEFDELSRKRVPRWLKKLASISVNYLQGWLAWQGVKRAALERDRNMPKFPLF